MTDKRRGQACLAVDIGFKRKNAEHQVDGVRHSFDASSVPSPYLRADVINDFLSRRLPSQCACKAQVEAWIINQDDRVRLALPNFAERFVKLISEITIFPEHFP